SRRGRPGGGGPPRGGGPDGGRPPRGWKPPPPAVSGTARPANSEDELLTVFAVDVGNQEAVRAYGMEVGDDLRVDDPFTLFAQPDSVVLVRSFAAARGLAIGDRIELVTPVGRRPFTVRGLLE